MLSPLANDASQFGKEKQRQYIYLTPKAPKRVLVALIIVNGSILRLVKKSRVSNVGRSTLQQCYAFVIKIQILVILHWHDLVLGKRKIGTL